MKIEKIISKHLITTNSVTLTILFILLIVVSRHCSCAMGTRLQFKRDLTKSTLDITTLHSDAVDEISTDRIRQNLEYYAGAPHVAGSEANYQKALEIQKRFIEYGFDKVEIKKYNVLLSIPGVPGSVTLTDDTGNEIFRTRLYEKILDPAENMTNILPPYNAFSPAGTVKGKLVYAYFGRSKDFKRLKEEGVNVTGKIAIIRYGRGGRGQKVERAARAGAIGAILYADPEDFARDGMDKVYPDYNWLPSTGVPRGSVKTSKGGGDLLTPFYPSIDGIYRVPLAEIMKTQFASIPSLPISYGDAQRLLSTLTGTLPKFYWKGGLPIIYGVQTDDSDRRRITLNVNTETVRKDIHNVIGYIRGHEEPDQLVIIGNHRDAWVYGGADPSSGTAAMMEIARVFGILLKKGWKPKRTIVFASWDAEESGLIGSTEWIEEYAKILQTRGVAYINVDMAIDGNFTFLARSMPLLEWAIADAAKKVPSPDGIGSVFDQWRRTTPEKDNPDLPHLSRMCTDSDYSTFYHMIGVPTMDIRYSFNKSDGAGNPLYHTLHDTYRLLSKLIDPTFKFHQATARVWALVTLDLADSVIIPFNITHYAERIAGYRDNLKDAAGKILADNKISLESLDNVIKDFKVAAKQFENIISNTSRTDSMNIRLINSRLTALERSFIDDGDTPIMSDITVRRHVLLSSPRSSGAYKLPGIRQSIRHARRGKATWDDVKKQISIVVYAIQSAIKLLRLSPI